MRILAIDTETSGRDPKTHRVTEIGVCLFDTDAGILHIAGDIIRAAPKEPPLSAAITRLTGITDALREEFGREPVDVLEETGRLAGKADYLAAHNAEFDRSFVRAEVLRLVLAENANRLAQMPWIDTLTDLPLDYEPESFSLKALLADHRIINPVGHRAAFDAVMVALLIGEYPIEKIIERAKSPTLLLKANTTFDTNALARARKFSWDAEKKRWWKKVKECDLQKEGAKWKEAAEALVVETGQRAFASATFCVIEG